MNGADLGTCDLYGTANRGAVAQAACALSDRWSASPQGVWRETSKAVSMQFLASKAFHPAPRPAPDAVCTSCAGVTWSLSGWANRSEGCNVGRAESCPAVPGAVSQLFGV